MPVRLVEKLSEGRIFFDVHPNPPREGDPLVPLSTDQEHQLALRAKLEWEGKHRDKTLVNFHKDPMAGGLVPDERTDGVTMISYPMWVAEVIVRQFRDDAEKDAWLGSQK